MESVPVRPINVKQASRPSETWVVLDAASHFFLTVTVAAVNITSVQNDFSDEPDYG